MSDPFSRVWAWSSGCSLASSVAAMFQVKDVLSVVDSQAGDGSFSLQLNVQTDDDRLIQNVIEFYNDSSKTRDVFAIWGNDLSDRNGQIPSAIDPTFDGAVSIERLPSAWPTRLGINDTVNLGFSVDGVGKVVAVLLVEGSAFLQVSKAPFATYQTKGFKSVNPAVVGAGNSSVATFAQGSFEILASLGDVGDLIYDGQGYGPTFFQKSQPPTICRKQPPTTNENANLKYVVTEASNQSLRMTASL